MPRPVRAPTRAAGRRVDRRLRERGVTLDVVAGAVAPQTWDAGTTALMEAASVGNDRLLDDLVTRHATLHDRDISGSTALHHAAAGNLHAIDALVAVGLDPDQPNADGFTPYRLAIAACRLHAGWRLADLGPDTGAGAGAPVIFHRSHRRAMLAWLVVPVLDVAAAVIVGVTVHPLAGLVVGVALLGVLARLAPPRQYWAGGARLRSVTAAAIGGSSGRQAAYGARWIVLDHPDGPSVDRVEIEIEATTPIPAIPELDTRDIQTPRSPGRSPTHRPSWKWCGPQVGQPFERNVERQEPGSLGTTAA